MNEAKLAIQKLEEIASAAQNAQSLIDKSALYGAARWLCKDLEEHLSDDDYASEKIELARWWISAQLGFDITNDKTPDQCYQFALSALMVLGANVQ